MNLWEDMFWASGNDKNYPRSDYWHLHVYRKKDNAKVEARVLDQFSPEDLEDVDLFLQDLKKRMSKWYVYRIVPPREARVQRMFDLNDERAFFDIKKYLDRICEQEAELIHEKLLSN